MLPIDIRFNSSVLDLCTCKVIKWLRRFSFMVARRYVLTLLREEKDLSLMAFVAGITSKSFTTLITSESRFFLAGLRLLNCLFVTKLKASYKNGDLLQRQRKNILDFSKMNIFEKIIGGAKPPLAPPVATALYLQFRIITIITMA